MESNASDRGYLFYDIFWRSTQKKDSKLIQKENEMAQRQVCIPAAGTVTLTPYYARVRFRHPETKETTPR